MSGFGERLDQELRKGPDPDRDGPFVMAGPEKMNAHSPGVMHFKEWALKKVQPKVKAARNYFAGAGFRDGEHALGEISEYLQEALMLYGRRCFAAGYMVGSNPQHFPEPGKVNWEREDMNLNLRAAALALDAEMTKTMLSYYAFQMTAFGRLMGAKEMVGRGVDHVWICWHMILDSSAIAFYLCGHRIGTEDHEREVLNGIQEASRE